MQANRTHLQNLLLCSTVAAAVSMAPAAFAAEVAAPAPAPEPASASSSTQPAPPAQTPPAANSSKRVNSLKLEPDGGSGPDKTKFNIVSKKEAAKQQGRSSTGGGNSQAGDGSGSDGVSSGN